MVSFRPCSPVIMASCFWSLFEVRSFLGLCQRSQYWCASTPLPHALLLRVSQNPKFSVKERKYALAMMADRWPDEETVKALESLSEDSNTEISDLAKTMKSCAHIQRVLLVICKSKNVN